MRKFFLLDEWMYLTSGDRLIEREDDRFVFRRYLDVIKKCK